MTKCLSSTGSTARFTRRSTAGPSRSNGPIEIIKIDQSFIRNLQIDAEDGAIVDAVVGLGRALKIQVVAEGVETVMQRDFLSALGCGVGQGYLFGSALPADRISELLLRSVDTSKLAA